MTMYGGNLSSPRNACDYRNWSFSPYTNYGNWPSDFVSTQHLTNYGNYSNFPSHGAYNNSSASYQQNVPFTSYSAGWYKPYYGSCARLTNKNSYPDMPNARFNPYAYWRQTNGNVISANVNIPCVQTSSVCIAETTATLCNNSDKAAAKAVHENVHNCVPKSVIKVDRNYDGRKSNIDSLMKGPDSSHISTHRKENDFSCDLGLSQAVVKTCPRKPASCGRGVVMNGYSREKVDLQFKKADAVTCNLSDRLEGLSSKILKQNRKYVTSKNIQRGVFRLDLSYPGEQETHDGNLRSSINFTLPKELRSVEELDTVFRCYVCDDIVENVSDHLYFGGIFCLTCGFQCLSCESYVSVFSNKALSCESECRHDSLAWLCKPVKFLWDNICLDNINASHDEVRKLVVSYLVDISDLASMPPFVAVFDTCFEELDAIKSTYPDVFTTKVKLEQDENEASDFPIDISDIHDSYQYLDQYTDALIVSS